MFQYKNTRESALTLPQGSYQSVSDTDFALTLDFDFHFNLSHTDYTSSNKGDNYYGQYIIIWMVRFVK